MSSTSNAIRNVPSFALVAVMLLGLGLETSDVNTDNARGVLLVGVSAAVGVAASLVYSRLERSDERAARVRIAAWTFIRLFLAFELTRYGVAKIVGMQFYQRYYQLDSRALDMKPMSLAWTFFGRSYGYQAISGVLEIAGAALLCFRRTTTLGGCLVLTVLANVVLVDFYYDVPVKLFASVYLTMTLYVLAWDARRFWIFFLGDEPVPPRTYLAPSKTPLLARALVVVLVLGLPAGDIVHKAFQRRVFTRDALEGAWDVGERSGLDDLLPTAAAPWTRVYFEKGDYGFIRVGKQRVRFSMRVDETAHTLRLSSFDGRDSPPLDGTFRLDGHSIHFEGLRDGAPFSIDMTREFPQ
jgi:hypothetical protein